jgi:uncharacterized protein (DUF1697 family)
MARVVLLRGINVGGHRAFRPTTVTKRLRHLDVVNIGAAGTFVVRAPVSRRELRTEFVRMLPFGAEIAICEGREVCRLVSEDPFAGERTRADVTRFVSIFCRRPRSLPAAPITLPPRGKWLLKVLGAESRFVFGLYRRQMKVITYLGALDRLFGAPVTTRSWNTIMTIARVLTDSVSR